MIRRFFDHLCAYDKLSSKITYNFFPTYYSSSKVLYTEGAVDRTAQNIW